MVDRNILEKWELEKNIKSKIIEEVYDYLKKCKQEQKKKHLEEIDVFRILYPQDIYLKPVVLVERQRSTSPSVTKE